MGKIKYIILPAAVLITLLAAGLWWILSTSAGARWILLFLSHKASISAEAGIVEGSFLKGLELEKVRLQSGDLQMSAGEIRLRLQPRSIFTGNIVIRELIIDNILVQDNSPKKRGPPDLAWPSVPGIMKTLNASIEKFRITQLVYRKAAEPPVRIPDISSHVLWFGGALYLSDLSISSPFGNMKGAVYAGLTTPSLKLDISAYLPEPQAIKKIIIRADLSHGGGREQVAGRMAANAFYSESRSVGLDGEIGVTRSSLNLRKIHVTETGLKGNIIAGGEVVFPEGDIVFRIRAALDGLDLKEEIQTPTDITGTLGFEGTTRAYTGSFSITNKGSAIQTASVSGSFKGDAANLSLTVVMGSWLDGKIAGDLEASWKEEISVRGKLMATGLNPAVIHNQWTGSINLALDYDLSKSPGGSFEGIVRSRLLESTLRGRALTGQINTKLVRDDIILSPLELHGKGFDIHAEGGLKERIAFTAAVPDLSGLVPGAAGNIRTMGWVSYSNGDLSISAEGTGRSVSIAGAATRKIDFKALIGKGRERPIDLRLLLSEFTYRNIRVSRADIAGRGTASNNVISAVFKAPGSELNISLSGSYGSGTWKGRITSLRGKDKIGTWTLQRPSELSASKAAFSVSNFSLAGPGDERIEVSSAIRLHPLSGYLNAGWKAFNAAHANQWMTDLALSGKSSGGVAASWTGGKINTVKADVDGFGTITAGGSSLAINSLAVKMYGGTEGMSASCQLFLGEQGKISGGISSTSPVSAGLPEKGEISANINNLNPSVFQPWLPRGLTLKGLISGSANGHFSGGGRVVLNAAASVPDGKIDWQQGNRRFTAEVRDTKLNLIWQGPALSGNLNLTLAEYGTLRSTFSIPLPARVPIAAEPKGAINASVAGQMKVDGLLASTFPGLIEESRGDATLDMRIGGQWSNPVMAGTIRVSNGAGYVPAWGIHVRNVSLLAHADRDKVMLDSIRAESGKGSIEGSGSVILRDWTPAEFTGKITGKNFQILYLPEVQVFANPDLTVQGTSDKMIVRGAVLIPELTVTGFQQSAPVTPSKDVVIVDAQEASKQPPFPVDLDVKVTLGDKVLVKAQGADIQLKGSVEFTAANLEDIKGNGTFTIAKGTYKAYGVDLNITKGVLTFKGPAERPRLNIQAERKAGEVTAGVFVTGTLEKPVIKLYSRPPMADADIMTYLVLGHPLQGGNEELSLVTRAAGTLLSKSDSASIQDQLTRRLGLSTLDIESVQQGAFGQKEFLTPQTLGREETFTTSPEAQQTGVGTSLVTVGKYLTPKLYISYGRSLFINANLVRLRYKFSEHWEIETQSGVVTGGDVFYRVRFR